MKTQLDWLKEAVRLAEEHPEMKIHFAVDSEEILDDSQWTAHFISGVEISWWWQSASGETILTDLERIADEISDRDDRDLSLDEAEKEASRVIIIYTNAG